MRVLCPRAHCLFIVSVWQQNSPILQMNYNQIYLLWHQTLDRAAILFCPHGYVGIKVVLHVTCAGAHSAWKLISTVCEYHVTRTRFVIIPPPEIVCPISQRNHASHIYICDSNGILQSQSTCTYKSQWACGHFVLSWFTWIYFIIHSYAEYSNEPFFSRHMNMCNATALVRLNVSAHRTQTIFTWGLSDFSAWTECKITDTTLLYGEHFRFFLASRGWGRTKNENEIGQIQWRQ